MTPPSIAVIAATLLTADLGWQQQFRNAANAAGLRTWLNGRVRGFTSTDPHCFIIHTEIMALTIGTQLGSHEITALLGKGGMGEVYRARDLKLKREVAIKILPEEFSCETDRVNRFQREAEVLASLNHPNIAAIYDLAEANGFRYLVLELVEGETLADRIARGPTPLEEALDIVKQTAEALEAAHDRGIIHRDLKPGNIKVNSSGVVKVLDFGLAKILDRASKDMNASDLPTQVSISNPSLILGTPAYMSPEQARGEETSRSADVWALGCVFFELLTCKRPFAGKTQTELLAEIFKAEPDWETLPPETPLAVRRVLHRCLRKDVRSRFHDIGDVPIALEDAAEAPVKATAVPRWGARAAWVFMLLFIAAVAVFLLRPQPASREWRAEIITPREADAGGIALSPDGTKLAYTALSGSVALLYVRSLENGSVHTLVGTSGAAKPFWSPDGHSIGFFADSKLKRVDLDTEAIQPLADASLSPSGGSWGPGGTILFSPNIAAGIFQVPAVGGSSTLLVPDGMAPTFLEDGKHFLFTTRSKIHISSLNVPDRRPLIDGDLAWPGPPGYLLLMKRGRGLFVEGFDMKRLAMTGEETAIAPRIMVASDGESASVTASRTGVIAYREATENLQQTRIISWFDRSGTEIHRVSRSGGVSPAISPDGAYVAFSRGVPPRVWLLETARGIVEPFTPNSRQATIWSPDGRNIVYSGEATQGDAISIQMFMKPANGGEEKLVIDPPNNKNNKVATDWRGDYLLYRESFEGQFDIWALPMTGNDRKPFPVLKTEYAERDAQFSPDMRWIAYESNKSSRSEIYMTRFPKPGREFQVSTNGGAQVRWNPKNPNEVFYVALDGRLMAVSLQFSADGENVKALEPTALFPTRLGSVLQGAQKQQYVVSQDGQSFLMSIMDEEILSPVTLILNWRPSR